MKTRVFWSVATMLAVLVGVNSLLAADSVDLKDIKCPLSGQPAKATAKAEHHDAAVYFCCPKCVAAFQKDPEKYTAKANHQLLATKQVKQVKCPKTGGPFKDATAIKVSGVKVAFCCKNCKGWAEKSSGDELIAKLFNAKAFKKGFKAGSDDESK